MNPDHPDLAGLLRGDLVNLAAIEAADHARSCASCREDLVDLSVGHGLLTAAARWTELVPSSVNPSVDGSRAAELPAALRRGIRGSGRRRRLSLAVAAGVAAIAAVSAALLLPGDDKGSRPPAAAAEIATLKPVSGIGGAPGGEVFLAIDRSLVAHLRVDTADLPRPARGNFYYVWLLDTATNKMLPLGQVVPGHQASFDLQESLVAAYSAIDISLESDDGDPGHSVTSVLRASYDPPRTLS